MMNLRNLQELPQFHRSDESSSPLLHVRSLQVWEIAEDAMLVLVGDTVEDSALSVEGTELFEVLDVVGLIEVGLLAVVVEVALLELEVVEEVVGK